MNYALLVGMLLATFLLVLMEVIGALLMTPMYGGHKIPTFW